MKVSNYEITRNRMRDEFIKYDQEKNDSEIFTEK